MLIYNKNLSVVPLTTHINIKKSISVNKSTTNQRKIDTLSKEFQRSFKRKPKIGVLGLNPHNSEMSKNSEEFKKLFQL